MALEAGEQMHEVFAAVRIWQLAAKQNLEEHALNVGERIFGASRWGEIEKRASSESADFRSRDYLLSLCFATLHTGEFFDDPSDDIRTISNMELASIAYIDARLPVMEYWPIWVEHDKKPAGLVGVEQTFDVVLEFADGYILRYIGTIDGLTVRRKTNEAHLDENKTASRLDDGWRESFKLSHQITGYCASSTTLFGFPVLKAHVFGVKIKQSKYGENLVDDIVTRDEAMIQIWASWLRWTVEALYEPFHIDGVNDFEHAPRFTHSCNRYFRPCALLTFCADTAEGRAEQWEEMVPAEPSPSERAVTHTRA